MTNQFLAALLFLFAALSLSGCVMKEAVTQQGEVDLIDQSSISTSDINQEYQTLLDNDHYTLSVLLPQDDQTIFVSGKQLCLENKPNGYHASSVSLRILDKPSGGNTAFALSLLDTFLNENSCLEFEKVVSRDQLIFSKKKGDGLALTREYYLLDLLDRLSRSLYKVRSWEVMEDDGVVEYVAWVNGDSYLLQRKQGEKAGSVHRGVSEEVKESNFFLDESGEVVYETTEPLRFDPLSEENIQGYKEGLVFHIDAMNIVLTWR